MDFFIDTKGDVEGTETYKTLYLPSTVKITEDDSDEEILDCIKTPSFISTIISEVSKLDSKALEETQSKKKTNYRSKKDINLEEVSKSIGWTGKKNRGWNAIHTVTDELTKEFNQEVDNVLKKSVITPDFETQHSVPTEKNKRQAAAERRREREKTKGAKWYGLPATELTEEVKHDLEVIQMRSVLDPKHFYKKNDMKVLPKYFQIGKVMDSPLDYYSNRCTKKERKRTLVDELLADAEFNKYNKRRYKEIIDEKQKTHYKAYRQAKKLKRKRNR